MSRRTHERIEDRDRLDALDLRYNSFMVGYKFIPILSRTGNTVKLPNGELHIETMHSRVTDISFLICPKCGSRRRFLYFPDLVCRDCAKLNYRIQQRGHGDRRNATEFLSKHLSGSEARPPGMRKKRYNRMIQRYRKHKEAAEEREEKAFYKFCYAAWKTFEEDGEVESYYKLFDR